MLIVRSLKFKLTVAIIIFVIVLMGPVISLINRTVSELILLEAIEKGLAIARGIASGSEDPLLTNDDLYLYSHLKGVIDNRGVVYAMIVDKNNIVRAHNNVNLSGQPYIEPDGDIFKVNNEYVIKTYSDKKEKLYDITVPISSVRSTDKIGTVHVVLSEKIISEPVDRARRNINYLTLLGLLLGGGGAFMLASVMLKPINLLVSGVRAIGHGKFHQRIDVRRSDEIGELTSAFNDMAKGLEEREYIRNTLRKFVDKDIADELLKNPDKVKLGGERKKVSVLFADIRGFTQMSENMPPEEVVALLNKHYSSILPIIDIYGGVLDKFIGDAIMVTFGTPFTKDDDALRAVKAGLMIRDIRRGLNEKLVIEGKEPIRMGIGINTGYVVAGNIGSEERMEYTVLGDVVNIAARIEGLSIDEDIIITEDTYKEVMGSVIISQEKEKFALKGKSKPVIAYTVIDLKHA
jgi:class 3 adenylate cyclase